MTCIGKIELKMVKMEKLKPHEDVLPHLVDKLIEDVKRRGLLHPVVVDKSTYVIIDGHHRVEALKRLGLEKIPALLVDYKSSIISLRRWYYVLDYDLIKCEPWSNVIEDVLCTFLRRIVRKLKPGLYEAVLKHWKHLTRIYHDDVLELYWLIHLGLRDLPFKKVPEDQYRETMPVLVPPELNKGIVISVALRNKIFPPKTTRHIICVPIPEVRYRVS